MMKKTLLFLVLTIIMSFNTQVFADFADDNEIVLKPNETISLSIDIVNNNGDSLDNSPNIIFCSKNENIATIDSNGVITANDGEGVAEIIIGVNGVERKINVIVTNNADSFDSELYVAEAFLRTNEIMVGDDNGNFNPEKAMTRAEFAKIICKFTNNDSKYNGTNFLFTDVADDFWGFDYIMNAANEGLVLGYGNNIFGINDTLTEEQAITVLCRMLGDTYEDVSYIETSVNEKGGYSEGYISIAGERGIDIEGLQKTVPATRARVAKWLYQLYNIKNNF